MYVKSPEGVGVSGAAGVGRLLDDAAGLGGFAVSVGLDAFLAAFYSLYSSIRLIKSDFSKQSSVFIPTATSIFLSSFIDRPDKFEGISTGPLCLAYC